MANSIPGEAGKRVHAAFQELTAEFSVNISDSFYRMSRNVAEAIREIEPRSERERVDRDALVAEIEASAEASLLGAGPVTRAPGKPT